MWTLIGPGLGAVVAACQLGGAFGPGIDAVRYEMGMGLASAGLVMVVVAQLVAVAVGGALGYVLGRRAPFAVACTTLVTMAVGAVATGLANGPAMLTVGGVIAGLGAGAAVGAAVGLTGGLGEHRRPALLAVGLAAIVGLLVGLALGWMIGTSLSWRWAYLSIVPMVLVALVATAVGGMIALTRRAG